jgi:uncharacterized cupin superfamily protein
MTETQKKSFVLRASEISEQAATFSHPWNPNSHIIGTRMSALVGLQRTGVGLAKIPPGKESFIYHAHHQEEEWIYILSGRGIAEIEGETLEVSAGDFMGFPTPFVAHHLRNPYGEELIYLVGGENVDVEIVDFPHQGKRMLRRGEVIEIYDASNAKPFGPLQEI